MFATWFAMVGCAEEPRSTGPPRCEPPDELVLERGLKSGFRALAEDNSGAARVAFQEVLTRAPGHPEARAGMRVAEQSPHHRTTSSEHGGIVAEGHDVPTHRPVDHDTYRLEVRAAEARAARRLKIGSPPDGTDF
ncbi:MAG: hypothetical protein QF464_23530, partial [Myxococcota bacterium]|nr:hypothetical protein [Myxococcota bacterium]